MISLYPLFEMNMSNHYLRTHTRYAKQILNRDNRDDPEYPTYENKPKPVINADDIIDALNSNKTRVYAYIKKIQEKRLNKKGE